MLTFYLLCDLIIVIIFLFQRGIYMKIDLNKIRMSVGQDSFNKGRTFPSENIKLQCQDSSSLEEKLTYLVRSENHYLRRYYVEIHLYHNEIEDMDCNCPQFASWGTCKHVAACLLKYREEEIDPQEKKLSVSKEILNAFYSPEKENYSIKKALKLEISLTFDENYYESIVQIDMKIGVDKLYSLNNKFSSFLNVYEEGEQSLTFGKNFVYSPKHHYFTLTDEKIINYFVRLSHSSLYYNLRNLNFSLKEFSYFLELLEGKNFYITGHGEINKIIKENPIQLSLQKRESYYKLAFLNQEVDFLTNDCQYMVKDCILYVLPSKSRRILSLMQNNHLHDIEFKEEQLDVFKKGLLPIIQNNLILDETLEGEMVIGIKPIPKLYFDLEKDHICCHLKFAYQDKVIDFFEDDASIVRHYEEENEVLQELLSLGFENNHENLYLLDWELIGDFLEHVLPSLATRYEIFTSDKMKETKILKNNPIHSHFGIGKDHVLSYDFDLGEIKESEIVSILEELKNNKKYYRLKNGDLLDLSQNEDLKAFGLLVKDLGLSSKEIKTKRGALPKYRAIYLDLLKKERYSIIKTNNQFDALIKQFDTYKDAVLSLSVQDKKILREYQQLGVQWLYHLYKCGFGGLLADEMGLGKSIQLIYLIKMILKEKPKAKILIVAPTSLIYNWSQEFFKFGKEIQYKVFAESKERRKQELEALDQVQVLITTYGLIRQDQEKYLAMNFEVIAIDEAQTIKNAEAQMTKILKKLKASCKFALTGTPLENSVLELWSIFDFILPGYLTHLSDFQKKYQVKDVTEEHLSVLEQLNTQIRPFLLRRKKGEVVKELPPKIENNISIDLNQEQKKMYKAFLEKTKKEMDEIIVTEGFKKGSFKILQLLTRLRQICIDPQLVVQDYQGGSAKIEQLIHITQGIIENGHKILLFTSFKKALEIVEKEFKKNHISTVVIDGSVPAKKRMELVTQFNQDSTSVFLITLKAGGTGLNLTSADVVIHLDLWWNPQVENQATDRAHRIGQTKTVEVIKLICKGTIEERILELQTKKKILSESIIEGKDRDQNIFSQLTEKDIKDLLILDQESLS